MKKGTSLGLCVLTLIVAVRAQGADGGSDLSPGWFAGANLRANFIEDTHLVQVDTSHGGTVKFDPGLGIGFHGGYRFCDWFALEGETGFTANSITSMTGASVHDTDLLQVPYMANAVFTVPRLQIVPFFGFGLGGTTSVIDTDHITVGNRTAFGSDSTVSFSYTAFAGLHYAINSQISIGLLYDYRFVDGPRWDRGNFPIEIGDLHNHSVGVSATFRF
jgi:opacity protein-like surface antigen